jgi:hypothetical protein
MAGVSIDVEVLMSDKSKEDKEIKLPECWVCMDTGMILYNKKTELGEYEYIAHCICQAGLLYHYDGKECKNKSPYYIPSVAEVADPATIAKDNIIEFYERNKNNEKVVKTLEMRGIKIRG